MTNALKTILSHVVCVLLGIAVGFVLAFTFAGAGIDGASGAAASGILGFIFRHVLPNRKSVEGTAEVVHTDVSSALAAASAGRREAEQRIEELTKLNAGLQQRINELQADADASAQSGQQLDNLITGRRSDVPK